MLSHAKTSRSERKKLASTDGEEQQPYESIMESIIWDQTKFSFSEKDIQFVAGGVLDGAADTSVFTAFHFLTQALAAHPHVQRRAQEEIDAVLGHKSVPEEGKIDMLKLPYLAACVTEILRWWPTSASGSPRVCLADQVILGHRIPKGSIVIMNIWALSHDPDEYDRRDHFEPERFLRNPWGTKHSRANQDSDSSWRKPIYAFGAGRRECPGQQYGLEALHVAFELVLWAYDIVADQELDLSPSGIKCETYVSMWKCKRVNFMCVFYF
ncbi:cytochrome P450 [Cladorrhinum sp. PSN259]|nr:cytochrome P450 [Cladorrhinum sp. PSN259]